MTRASVDTAGGDPDAQSFAPSLSSDGRYVAFESAADDLLAGDDNHTLDIYLRDLVANTTTRVSIGQNGADANGQSFGPSISDDGRYVAFSSSASNLVANDTSNSDIFLRDLHDGTTRRITNDRNTSLLASISGDGRYVTFESLASDLVPGDRNGLSDVFRYDRTLNKIERVSVDTSGGDAGGSSDASSISANGRYVAFDSTAPDLVADDGNGLRDVFVRDMTEHTTVRVSLDRTHGDPDGESARPDIAAGGRFIAFASSADDLVPGDGNGTTDIFVFDRDTSTTERASVDSAGHEARLASSAAVLGLGARYVAFISSSDDLVPGDTNGVFDVFVRDRVEHTTTRVSVDAFGREGTGNYGTFTRPALSADGRFVAFDSALGGLVPGDHNDSVFAPGNDVFVRAVQAGGGGPS